MAYNEIQQAAFVPNPEAEHFIRPLHTLAFPATWREPILNLYTHGRPEAAKTKIKSVPIRRLNSLMRAVAPDLITVDGSTTFEENKPWLYADEPYPQAVLDSMIHAWLRDMKPSDEAYPLFRETVRALSTHDLKWQVEDVDLRAQDISPGGTALPHDRLYRLVPEILADRIAQLHPYEHAGEQLRFHRVAVDARANGAELMSWPPLEHSTKGQNGVRIAYYSAVIRVALRTVPFSPTPRVHISTGVRRWVSGPVYFPGKNGVSTYLLTNDPLVPDGTRPHRFAVASLIWDRKTRKTVWRQGGPEGLLNQVSALDNLPSPDVFAKEPDAWIHGRDGVTAAVAFHSRMKWHPVGTGLMPSERRRLTEWAAEALTPEFIFASPLHRSEIKQNPARALEKNVPISKDATDPERAQAHLDNAAVSRRNAEKRRVLAAATNDNLVTAVLLHQTSTMRQHVLAAVESSLGLAEYRRATGPELWSWEAPELSVRLHLRPLGALGAPLGNGDKPPRRGQEFDDAIRQRRDQAATTVTDLCDRLAERPPLVLVELEGPERFQQPRTDPKFAIRLGCADAGTVTQFLRPPSAEPDDDDAFRAAAAWGDGMRQLGMRFVPQHTLGDAIPDQLNQLAFWLVKRRVDGPTQNPQFTPVAVLIRPGQNCIMGRTATMSEWVPYPELLKSLTGQIRPDNLKTDYDQTAATAAFVKNTLYQMRSTPTLVVTHAQNTRNRWPWLQNGGLVVDRIQVGMTSTQRITTYGKHLRIVRIATGDRDETAQWWAPKPEGTGGISKGLWQLQPSDDRDRVFYSTTDKASTHTLAVDTTKLTPRITAAGKPDIKPAKNAWNPDLLEFSIAGLQPSDTPAEWAMFLHQQRFSEDYRDGLGLPLILHLAELTSHYALPHGEELDGNGVDESEGGDESTAGDNATAAESEYEQP